MTERILEAWIQPRRRVGSIGFKTDDNNLLNRYKTVTEYPERAFVGLKLTSGTKYISLTVEERMALVEMLLSVPSDASYEKFDTIYYVNPNKETNKEVF